ncbi:MAG: tol-pal system YbgF family protein [Chthoniobacterales bacterium]
MQTASTSSPDPLLETQVFWVRYKTQILAVLLVILLGVTGFAGYRLYSARRNAAAAELLARAREIPDYQKLIAEYPRTAAAASASLLLAARQREKQQFAEANGVLQAFIRENPMHELVTTAKMASAANLESLGKADEALEMYRQTAAEYPNSYNAPLALLAQLHLLKQKGQIDEARRVCETILTQYRASQVAAEASRHLRLLKPSAGAAALPRMGEAPPAAAESVASAAPSVSAAAATAVASTAPTP